MGPPPAPTNRPLSLLDLPHACFDAAVVYWNGGSCNPGFHSVPRLLDSLSLNTTSETEILQEHTPVAQVAIESESGFGALNRWACGTCGSLDFPSLDDQRFHFKSDFHRLNVKRRLIGKDPLTEEEFEVLAQGHRQEDDDVSSLSGSGEEDSDSEGDTSRQNRAFSAPKLTDPSHISLLLQNSGEIVSMWKCVLLGDRERLVREKVNTNQGSEQLVTEDELLRRLKILAARPSEDSFWVVLLSRGGHFAGCVFQAKTGSILAHKTHHRYVVRAKAGGRQSSKDGTGRAPKSAGASLRRHNEAALQREIRDVLASWKGYLQAASCIFVHAPSSNSHALFSGEDAPLDRNDFRIRNVPLTTHRPTFKETKRVFNELIVLTQKQRECADVPDELRLSTSGNHELNTKSSINGLSEQSYGVSSVCDTSLSTSKVTSDLEGADVRGGNGSTPLHDAASSGNLDLVLELLDKEADPCARDERGRTPYTVAVNKETRNVFRRFMAEHSEMWDWHAANVPSVLTDEMIAAQAAKQAEKEAKKKAKAKELKKLRKAKQKAQAQIETSEQPVAVDLKVVCHGEVGTLGNSMKRNQKVGLSVQKDATQQTEALEREKRAAAAERRIFAMRNGPETRVNNISSSSNMGSCCSCCGASLAGLTPFYRFSYQYCSTVCVNVHRVALEGE